MREPDFFPPSRTLTAAEIAAHCGARLHNPDHADVEICGVAPLHESGAGQLVYIEQQRQANDVETLHAAAILCPQPLADRFPDTVAVLISEKPKSDFAAVSRLMFPTAVKPAALTGETGISEAAHIAAGAKIEAGAIVEAGAVVGAEAEIGSGTVIAPNAVIGSSVRIGRDCYVGPGVSVIASLLGNRVSIHAGARIGQDGFGFVPGKAGLEKQPQTGRVIIQDDVEIGANSTVDRGAMADTIIGEGTKIDNLVQVAHNVRIGRHCAVAAHCGISGSCVVGDYVMLGGRVGLADHISVGDGAQLAANAGVMHDVPAGGKWAGAPAKPWKEFFREVAALKSLADHKKTKGKSDG